MINKLLNLSHKNKIHTNFPQYILSITFPYYKNLEQGSKINFDFPLTVFVGPNGSGKSSALQAIYGCPGNNSTGNYWFSTALDPIKEVSNKGLRNSYWYEYFNSEANRKVQVLKYRIKYRKKQTDGKIKNIIDYWEPSRPGLKYGMEMLQELDDNEVIPGRSKTRWNTINKNVIYLDFRSELSAFDKYFYFSNAPRLIKYYFKQDYIRYFSSYLYKIFKNNLNSFKLRGKEKVFERYKFSDDELEMISDILGRRYQAATLIEHNLYKQKGSSVLFQTTDKKYSEAFAGSGELSVAKLVYNINKAEKNSLILLDEPEVSLHPGAQKRLKNFLLKQIHTNRHQIIISTHSPALIEELPAIAIKVFNQTPSGTFRIISEVSPELAFQYIGHTNSDKNEIIVEDSAAKQLLIKILKHMGNEFRNLFLVNEYPGGAKDMFKEMVVFARMNEKKKFFWFDGDQKSDEIPNNESISNTDLDALIKKITNIDSNSFQFVANSNQPKQIMEEKRKFLSYLKSYTFFLPCDDPEDIILECSTLENKPKIDNSDSKSVIEKWTKSRLDDECDSNDISTFRKELLSSLDYNHKYIKSIVNNINKIVNPT